jgi:hypothetical protein
MTGLLQNGVRTGDTLTLLDAIVYALNSVQLKRRSLLIPGWQWKAGNMIARAHRACIGHGLGWDGGLQNREPASREGVLG